MSDYKRVYLANHSYFFTVVTANRNLFFLKMKIYSYLKPLFVMCNCASLLK